jgi:riboflavin-specific deaminase-like protein
MIDINTTPLIDVMLVLLVMLIITIPIQLHSVNLNLPIGNPPPPLVLPEVVKLDIDEESRIYWNGEVVPDRPSLESKMSAAAHQPVAISGEAARARVHLLRAQCDAILVGIGTVISDDPLLTCRLPGMEALSPVRVVLDASLRLPGTSRLVHSARETPLWVMTSNLAEAPAAMKLGAAGAQLIRVPTTTMPPGLDLPAVLQALAGKGITRLLMEGGARVASSFVAAGLVDEVWLLRGPDAIGADGRRAGCVAAVGNHAVARLQATC